MDSISTSYQIILGTGHLALEHGRNQKSQDAGSLGTRLILISKELEIMNPDVPISDDVPELEKVTKKLKSILQVTSYPSNKAQVDRARYNLAKFFKFSNYNERQELLENCDALLKGLEVHESPTHILAHPPNTQKIEYTMAIKKKLFSGLRKQSMCDSCLGINASQDSPRWHQTRLLLKQKPREDNCETIDFNIVVARIPQERWQDIGLSVPRRENSVKFAGEDTPHNSSSHLQASGLGQGFFCHILSTQIFARICFNFHNGHFFPQPDGQALEQRPCPGFGITLRRVLERHTLQLKDKIILAHLTAQALWQFYDTELLYRKWNSDCILFLPEQHKGVLRIPIKPYVSVQFEISEENIDEYLPENSLVHRYPRILAFGIMLIEIGLGRSLQLQQWDDLVTQVNADFDAASQGLDELKETSWANFSNKAVFIQAIVNCLTSNIYRQVDLTTATVPSSAGHRDGRASWQIDQIRRVFYDRVVWPLQWLAEVGFHGDQSTSYLCESQSSPQTSPSISTQKDLDEDIRFSSVEFHGGNPIDPNNWLNGLKAINKAIYPKLQNLVVDGQGVRVGERGIRVAILDTGYDPKAPLLTGKAAAKCFKGWKDFISGSDVPVDSFGHGTFMATLLIHSAPISEVYVARIAESTNNLLQSSSHVAQGIRWAAFEQNVDVISMSFGFPASDNEAYKQISEAIEEVKMKRDGKIIFLASAGNSGVYEDETFPATHPSVISIRATNSLGTFMNTNPRNKSESSVVFGAVGDDIPPDLQQFRPEVSLPGTSAATAVAAGIAAIMLGYVLILPQLVKIETNEHIMRRLWTTEGMRNMFMKMSDDMGERRRFINPSKFFLNKSNSHSRYCAIYDCL
ncbi:peptidase S8/S53 domain-containing protein [Trichoderma camerunense]